MSREQRLFLEDIVACCAKIEHYTQGLTQAEFVEHDMVFDAVLRNLTIISEAARQLSKEFRRQRAEADWRKIIGLRNILTHVYFGIDDDIVWDVVRRQIPRLREQVERMLDQGDG